MVLWENRFIITSLFFPNAFRSQCMHDIQLDFVRLDLFFANLVSHLIDTMTVKAKKCFHPLSLAMQMSINAKLFMFAFNIS